MSTVQPNSLFRTYQQQFLIHSTFYFYNKVVLQRPSNGARMNEWVSWCQENSYWEWLQKGARTSSLLLVGHYEERPIIPQPQCGRCHWAGTGQTTLEVYWQQAELCTEMAQAEQWWWWWPNEIISLTKNISHLMSFSIYLNWLTYLFII